MSAKGYRRPVRWQYYYVCRFLNANGPKTAGDVGAFVWRNKKRGRTTSVNGGGDYAAQMLLGRMRVAGLVRVTADPGASRWEVTAAGRREAQL